MDLFFYIFLNSFFSSFCACWCSKFAVAAFLKQKRSFSLACHSVSRKSEFFEISLHFKSALPKPCVPLMESTFKKKEVFLDQIGCRIHMFVWTGWMAMKMGTRACFTLGPNPKKSVDQFNLSMMATSLANFS